ncbi:uncharacterized protein LACBIDRAFT_334206 [Laccaria bicolor S238N-H82]|uniref:Predicted protein n=1 Tax=Laccaria bicolor (strain S238N-H82 / ATCC MYA-4686) TaxID=486041 RepID=B0DYG5_LACBS|nr:uncharacterized protein LACBIDRAFT_334206 [Laccaria bicolor S238N-H82]EDR00381.1 predicted protein [Laccaria bicolor S238N-H82]|eukprot:XP_001888940.1 predicted protein [Laccaria bicolor S238N-H82]
MAQSCFTTDGIEALGIGSRTHLYAQSLLIVFISFIVRKRGKPHTTATYLWRLQLYTFGALAIACIFQRSKGKLSMFYEIAAYHTGALLLWSAVVGMMIQKGESPLTLKHNIPVNIPGTGRKRRKIEVTLPTLTPSFILLGCLIYMVLAWVIFFKDSSCKSDNRPLRWKPWPWSPPVTINGTGKGSLWVLLWLYVPMVAFILVPLVLRMAPCFKHFFSSLCTYALLAAYLLLWVKEVYGIEASIMINQLNSRNEFEFDFGQILSLVLVMPYMERVFNEIV